MAKAKLKVDRQATGSEYRYPYHTSKGIQNASCSLRKPLIKKEWIKVSMRHYENEEMDILSI